MREAAASFMGSGSSTEPRPAPGAKGTRTAAPVACVAPAVMLPFALGALAGYSALEAAGLALLGAALLALAMALALAGGTRLGGCADTRANRVTLLRLSAVTGLAVLTFAPGAFAPWPVVVVAVGSLILDGFDGRLARTDGDASDFGAWFDQETDALFVLVLGVLLWRLDRAGAWVIAAGAWRYVFLAATALVPRLGGELPFSRRRRVVCVVLLTSLIVCLSPLAELAVAVGVAPALAAGASQALAAFAVTLVSASFLIDLAWLWTASPAPRSSPLAS